MTHGFQDEEVLGKPYDARLVRRLLSFVRPYTKPVVVAIAMLLVVAGFELALCADEARPAAAALAKQYGAKAATPARA